ncbi:MAG: hypothetical protein GY768_04150 [Planctomycetaceae bacterium]|nr:hypothetical protein [Planctomycetaceae bacterium]
MQCVVDSISVSLAESDFVDLALLGLGVEFNQSGRKFNHLEMRSGCGDNSNFGMSIEITAALLSGDDNHDGVVNVADINLQAEATANAAPDLETYGENSDGVVDIADRRILVGRHLNTWMGDADLNSQFDSSDLVILFAAGKYETGASASWEECDWDGNGVFVSGELVAAFADGRCDAGPKVAVAAVPEPSSIVLALVSLVSRFCITRRRHG